jgi:hypothetical protein
MAQRKILPELNTDERGVRMDWEQGHVCRVEATACEFRRRKVHR